MQELISLWLPIVASTVAVHIASTICWMVSPHHKPDWSKLPNEDDMLEKVRSENIPSGQYIFPCVDMKEMKDPEVKKRWLAGPHGTVNVWKGIPNMGRNVGLTILFFLVTSVFVGYLASLALDPGATFSAVFQITGTAAMLAYCFAFIPNDIWFGTPCRAITMKIVDGVIYGLLTGVAFGLLWPAA